MELVVLLNGIVKTRGIKIKWNIPWKAFIFLWCCRITATRLGFSLRYCTCIAGMVMDDYFSRLQVQGPRSKEATLSPFSWWHNVLCGADRWSSHILIDAVHQLRLVAVCNQSLAQFEVRTVFFGWHHHLKVCSRIKIKQWRWGNILWKAFIFSFGEVQ